MEELEAYAGQPSAVHHSEFSSPTSFRALPLLSFDLPHTTINIISHSFVDRNNRSKKDLSLIIFVKPGRGKDGWKVEKVYSDILNLHQRVRDSVGKGALGKKIANLPEGKFWKGSPAKLDQSKAVLENYLQALIQLPVKNNYEVIAFFTSNIIREQRQIAMQVRHNKGYLTKKGRNLGGWKTQYFILQGPVLEYYNWRGGTRLGFIAITGAQITRQTHEHPFNTDDKTEYRHAFLIVEAKKSPAGIHPRHVLCAESDEDRDSWVDMLVRYYTGTYNEDSVFNSFSGQTSVQSNSVAASSQQSQLPHPRSSTSSNDVALSMPPTKPIARGLSQDEVVEESAVPVSLLPPDVADAKVLESGQSSDDYPRTSSPHKSADPSPIAPIPSGFRLGGKDAPSADPSQAANDRREKSKSRSFWGFGKANGDNSQLHAADPRVVFGVPLEEALNVAQICNLPAVVFRSIQYLEAKQAEQEEGIYSFSASLAVIKNLKDMFNNEGDIDLLASDKYWDPRAVAGLLKSFFRELPASILTRDLHLNFLAVIDLVDPQERIKELSRLISALPLANYSLLRALMDHLISIVLNSNVNRMTMRNVGIIFSPTLGIPAGVFSLMLGEFSRVFNVNAENDEVDSRSSSPSQSVNPSPIDTQGASAADIPKRIVDLSPDFPSSLSDSFPLSNTAPFQHDDGTPGQRFGSELGYYQDMDGTNRYQRIPSTSNREYATAPRLFISDKGSFDYHDYGRRDAEKSRMVPEWHTNLHAKFPTHQEASYTRRDNLNKRFGNDPVDDLTPRPDSRSSGYSSPGFSDAGIVDPTIHPNWRSKITRLGDRPLDLEYGSLSWHISSRRKVYVGSAYSGSEREAWKNESMSVSDDTATITSRDH